MRETTSRIEKMEQIFDEQIQFVQTLHQFLDTLEEKRADYYQLVAYYYSRERDNDLKMDDENVLPIDLKRGVLSEDGIYNLMGDYFDVHLRMIEESAKLLRHDYPR